MSDPGASVYVMNFEEPIQVVRHMIGDVDMSEPKLRDAEIAYELGAAANVVTTAAAACCYRLMARYADVVSMSDGELRVEANSLYDHYAALAKTFTNPSSAGLPSSSVPYAGGISRTDKGNREANTDRMPPLFERDVPGRRTTPDLFERAASDWTEIE